MYKKIGILFLSLACLICFSIPYLAPAWYRYLAVVSPVEDADVLLVEGWVSERTLNQAIEEYQQSSYSTVLTSSIQLPELVKLSTKGGLVYQLDSVKELPKKISGITVKAYSTEADNEHALISLWINRVEIAHKTAESSPKHYNFPITLSLDTIREIAFYFPNDYFDRKQNKDRNLYVGQLILGNKKLKARAAHTYVDHGLLDGEKTTIPHLSEAAFAAEYLTKNGIPKEHIQVVEAPLTEHNKTYASGLAVSKWVAGRTLPPRINMITESSHARRSWILYKKAIGDVELGIIASDPLTYDATDWWKHQGGRSYVQGQTLKYFYAILSYPFLTE